MVRSAVSDPPARAKEYRCLELAAAAGCAPQVVHLEAERGVAVMEKIEGAPVGMGGRSVRQPG